MSWPSTTEFVPMLRGAGAAHGHATGEMGAEAKQVLPRLETPVASTARVIRHAARASRHADAAPAQAIDEVDAEAVPLLLQPLPMAPEADQAARTGGSQRT